MSPTSESKAESEVMSQRRMNLRTAFILFFISACLIVVGVVLNDARHELLMFSDIEHEQNNWDNARVLLQTAGSYRNVILALWYLGILGLAAGLTFLGLAFRKPKSA